MRVLRRLRGLWRWFVQADERDEHRSLRARCGALGFTLPRTVAETLADLPKAAARKRRLVCWHAPDAAETARYAALIDVFADMFVAVAAPDGETWLLGERLFAGFPDPALYMAVFLDADDRVIAATELNQLPSAWPMPLPVQAAAQSRTTPPQ